jgi:hypothetical protein
VIAIHVMVRRILFVRRHCSESKAVSCSIAEIAVVRKHSVMARIILLCTEDSVRNCAVVGAVRVFSDLCQITAA